MSIKSQRSSAHQVVATRIVDNDFSDDDSDEEEESSLHAEDDKTLASSTSLAFSNTSDGSVISEIVRTDIESFNSIHLALVFEELADQLTVLARASKAPDVDLRGAHSVVYDEMFNRPVAHLNSNPILDKQLGGHGQIESHYILEQHHNTILTRRLHEMIQPPPVLRKPVGLSRLLRIHGVNQGTEAGRCQAICVNLQQVATAVVTDLIQNADVKPMREEINREQAIKRKMLQQCTKIVDETFRIMRLKEQIKNTKEDHKIESQLLNVEMWNIQNKFLEYDGRRPIEDSYVQHCGKMSVKKNRKRIQSLEKRLEDELADARDDILREKKTHKSMVFITNRKHKIAAETLDHWIGKYERDITKLNSDLEAIKKSRRTDLARIAWLQKTIPDYTAIVLDDRRLKELERLRTRQKRRELRKAIKIQAWWRGTMVRKRLGIWKDIFPVRASKNEPKDKKEKKK